MKTPEEIVAGALYEKMPAERDDGSALEWDELGEIGQQRYRRAATSIVSALREAGMLVEWRPIELESLFGVRLF